MSSEQIERPALGAEECLVLYRIDDVVRLLSLSRWVVYELIRAGRLRTVSQGRSRRVPASAIREYIELLEKEARDGYAA